jgi:hypothetical protein
MAGSPFSERLSHHSELEDRAQARKMNVGNSRGGGGGYFNSIRSQHMVQSQFGSLEALAPGESKSGLFFHSSERNLSIHRRHGSLLPSGEHKPGGVGGTFWSQWR